MLRKSVYPKIEGILNDWAKKLNTKGFTPNQLTLTGLGINFLAGWIFASGNFFLGGLVMLIAGLADMLDGPLARTSGKVSKFGAFLDSTIDRYSDFFLFGGIALYYANNDEPVRLFLVLGALAGAFVTSYAKCRAENFIASCSVGVFERSERIIALGVGSLFSFLMPLALWVLFIGTNATAVQRILYTQKNIPSEKSSDSSSQS